MSCRTGDKGSALTVGFNQSYFVKKQLVFFGGFPTRFAYWIIRLSFSKNEKQVSFITGVALAESQKRIRKPLPTPRFVPRAATKKALVSEPHSR